MRAGSCWQHIHTFSFAAPAAYTNQMSLMLETISFFSILQARRLLEVTYLTLFILGAEITENQSLNLVRERNIEEVG